MKKIKHTQNLLLRSGHLLIIFMDLKKRKTRTIMQSNLKCKLDESDDTNFISTLLHC